jgi:hypothetical protein
MINLFVSYYKAATPERQAEIDYCLKANCENPMIDIVYVLTNEQIHKLMNGKIVKMLFDGNPTYGAFFNAINAVTKPDDINIISNADIIFDETIALTSQLKANECWALSRWEMRIDYTKHPEQIQVYGDSQDCWIFRGKIKPLSKSDFPLGKLGCDNRIAYEIQKAGYKISNPSKSVHTWHLHNSNVRGYDPKVRNEHTVVSQPYLNVPVSYL